MKNKASTPLAILVLVFLTISLISYSLFAFIVSKEKSERQIYSVMVLESAYVKEQLINFYLSQGVSLGESIGLVEGASLEGEVVVIKEKFEDKDDKIEVKYKFIP